MGSRDRSNQGLTFLELAAMAPAPWAESHPLSGQRAQAADRYDPGVESLGILVGAGWASGINLYLVTLLLGLAGRLGWGEIPEVLVRTDVTIVAGILFAVEFVADKIPYVDNLWDAIHTVVRPVGAAALGAVLAGEVSSIGAAAGAGIAAVLALDAHAVKATTRLAVNTSPEPVSNIFVSLFEDLSVTSLIVLAVTYPVVALILVAILVVAATVTTFWLWKVARHAWAKVRFMSRKAEA